MRVLQLTGKLLKGTPLMGLRGNDDVREFYRGLSEAGRRNSFREIKLPFVSGALR